MKLIINGESCAHSADTLSALVEQLGMKPDRIAIELNREIVPRDRWPQTKLRDGDQLEIVHFVGGGMENPVEMGGGVPVECSMIPAESFRRTSSATE